MRTLLFFCLLSLPVVGFVYADDPHGGPTIILRDRVEVSAPTIALADIVDLTAPEETAAALGTVTIGPSPLPGLSRSITIGYIKVRLRQNHFDPDGMTFGGVGEVIVVRSKVEPPSQPDDMSPAPPDGEAHAQILAARRIPRGHVLTPDDLAPSTHPDLAQPLIGLRATRFIEAGVAITQAMLEPVPTVDRGDLVTLVIEVGAIRIRAMAEVRAPASVGGLTKVRVLQTNKLLDAQVLDSQTVSIPTR